MGSPERIDISVVVPCYRALPYIGRCLGSLALQSLDPARFEVVLIFNGPDDGARAAAEAYLSRTRLQHRILTSAPGASVARNRGIAEARGKWLTLLDVDDELSRTYLEEMAAAAVDPTVVPVAQLHEVRDGGEPTVAPGTASILKHRGITSAAYLWWPLTLNALKLLPTQAVRRHGFDESLRSGEDVALYARLFEDEGLSFDTSPAHAGAAYIRHVEQHSVSRQPVSYDFMVTQRLEIVARLEAQLMEGGLLGGACREFIKHQLQFVARYLQHAPDEAERVLADIRTRGIAHISWGVLPYPADSLLLTRDLTATTEPLRIVDESTAPWHAVSVAARETTPLSVSLDRVAREQFTADVRLDVEGPEEYYREALAAVDGLESVDGPHRAVASVGGWGPVHLLAATIAARGAAWTVHVDDPFWADPAAATWLTDDLPPTLGGGTDARRSVVEAVALGADAFVFQTPHLQSLFLDELGDGPLRERVLSRARLRTEARNLLAQPHPSVSIFDGATVDVTFFGDLDDLDLRDVVEAVSMLSPEEASQVRLHLYTPPSPRLVESVKGNRHPRAVTGYLPIGYGQMIGTALAGDVVLVKDSSRPAAGALHPWFPEHMGDLTVAGARIWAVAEQGSQLDRTETAFTSRAGDPASSAHVLRALIAARRP